MYKKNIAVFLIALIATMPFYVSSVFAQNQPFETSGFGDPVQSCIAKAEEGKDLVEALDSGPIKTLEGIASTLYFTCTAWATVSVAENTYISIVGAIDFCPHSPATPSPACIANTQKLVKEIHIKETMDRLCSIVECRENFIADSLGLNPISELQTKIRGDPKDKESLGLGIGPFDNIYSSIAYLCPVGILFNLRKLKTIYQTHSCCIEQACANGLNTESCDRQLSEATCMYWEGSIAQSLVSVLIHFISIFFAKALEDKVQDLIKEAGIGQYIAAIKALYNAYQHIQKLHSTFQWMSETFSEPNCDDLDFDDIRDEARRQASRIECQLVQIDLNGDGIFDRLEPRCA